MSTKFTKRNEKSKMLALYVERERGGEDWKSYCIMRQVSTGVHPSRHQIIVRGPHEDLSSTVLRQAHALLHSDGAFKHIKRGKKMTSRKIINQNAIGSRFAQRLSKLSSKMRKEKQGKRWISECTCLGHTHLLCTTQQHDTMVLGLQAEK